MKEHLSYPIFRACLPILALLLMATLGCTVIRPVSTNAVNYNRAIERTQNQTLLLNIVRASKRQPKVFSGLTKIQGVGSTGLSPTVAWGLSTSANDALTLGSSIQRGTAVAEVAALDSKEFMQGVLNPVSIEQIEHFWEQGWQRVLLLTLFLERVEMKEDLVRHLQADGKLGNVDFDRFCDGTWCFFDNRPSHDFGLVQGFADGVGDMVRNQAVEFVDDTHQKEGACVGVAKVQDVQLLLTASRDHSVVFEKEVRSTGICYQARRRVRRLSIGNKPVYQRGLSTADAAGGDVRAVVRSAEGIIHFLGQLMRYQGREPEKILRIDLYGAGDGGSCDPIVVPYGCLDRAAGVVFYAGEASEITAASAGRSDRVDLPRQLSVKHEGTRYVVPGDLAGDLSFSTMALVSNLLGLNRARDSEPSPGTVVVGVSP